MGLTNLRQAETIFGTVLTRATLTFANTGAGFVPVFTVTGDLIVRVMTVCATTVTSAAGANIELGVNIGGHTADMIAATLSTLLAAREIWHDATPDSEIEALGVWAQFIVADGNDVGLTLSAQVDTGAIEFYCFWVPLSAGASLVAA